MTVPTTFQHDTATLQWRKAQDESELIIRLDGDLPAAPIAHSDAPPFAPEEITSYSVHWVATGNRRPLYGSPYRQMVAFCSLDELRPFPVLPHCQWAEPLVRFLSGLFDLMLVDFPGALPTFGQDGTGIHCTIDGTLSVTFPVLSTFHQYPLERLRFTRRLMRLASTTGLVKSISERELVSTG